MWRQIQILVTEFRLNRFLVIKTPSLDIRKTPNLAGLTPPPIRIGVSFKKNPPNFSMEVTRVYENKKSRKTWEGSVETEQNAKHNKSTTSTVTATHQL